MDIKTYKNLKRLLRLKCSVVIDSYKKRYTYTDKKPIIINGDILLCLQSLDDFGYYYVNKKEIK